MLWTLGDKAQRQEMLFVAACGRHRGRDGGGERGREGSVDGDDLCGEIRPETVTFKAF